MALKMLSVDELVRIAVAGGGFTIDASMKSTDDLVRIAVAAGGGGGLVTFKGLSMRRVDGLARIGVAGKGRVIFED